MNNDLTKLKEVPAAWRYRALITVNHLEQHISTTQQELSVLRLFLQEVIYPQIKFVGDLQQVGGFLRFPSQIKLTTTI